MSQNQNKSAPPFPPDLVEGACTALREMLARLPAIGSMVAPYTQVSLCRTLYLRDADLTIAVDCRALMPWEESVRAVALASASPTAEDAIRREATVQQAIRKGRS